VDPSLAPTLVPSTEPSVGPIGAPTVVSSQMPTVDPSHKPTISPSYTLTLVPTRMPTRGPTARPTLEMVKPYEVVLGIEQDVYFVSLEAYVSQKVQCNLTIQHTVASSLEGLVPERVTDIEVTETESTRNDGNRFLAAAVVLSPVLLKYKVTVFDPVLSAEVLSKQLITKVQSGDMDQAFRAFAVMFNATRLENGTFSEPRITVLNKAYHGDPANSGEIAGFVLGGFLFLLVLTVGVWIFVKWLKKEENEKDQLQLSNSAVASEQSIV